MRGLIVSFGLAASFGTLWSTRVSAQLSQMTRIFMATVALGLMAQSANGQNAIMTAPDNVTITGRVFGDDLVIGPASLYIFGRSTNTNPNVKFKLDRISGYAAALPEMFLVSPASGTTPQRVIVSVNPEVVRRHLEPGPYIANFLFTTVDETPAVTIGAVVRVRLTAPPPPMVSAVINAASSEPLISPNAVVSLTGSNLGPPAGDAEYDIEGKYPTTFAKTTVRFNGVAAPLLYVSPSRIDVVVPYAMADQQSADVEVRRYGERSTFPVAVAETSPGIFTAGQNAIQNIRSSEEGRTYSYNSPENPAAQGSEVVLHATGAGTWEQDTAWAGEVREGYISLAVRPFLTRPVSLMIGGQPAKITYLGSAPYQSSGVLMIQASVPAGIGPGQQPVVLKIGENDNSAQSVTISVQ